LNLRAYSLFRLGRINEAIEGQRQSVAVDPGYAWGHFDLARFLCAAGSPAQVEEAKREIDRAIELEGDPMRERMKGDGEFRRVCRATL
jgi:tetratricopeptide (TPR) repeat protein